MSVSKDRYVNIANGVPNVVLLGVSSGLSAIGTMVIILTYIFIKEIRTVSRHVIVCISIADFVTCISNLYGIFIPATSIITTSKCRWQSFFSTTAILCSFLWTMMLGVYLYVVIVKEKQRLGKLLIIPISHIVCWSIPLAINFAAFYTHHLGNGADRTSSGWCWIKTHDSNGTQISHNQVILWMFVDGKGIELITYVVIIVLYIKLKIHLRTKIQNYDRAESPNKTFLTRRTVEAAKQTDKKLIFVPVILILLRIWGTIRFFLFLFEDDPVAISTFRKVLLHLHTIGDNLQGFMNCLLFCIFTPKVRNRVILCCNTCCRKLKMRKSDNDDDYEYSCTSSGEFY